MRKVIAAINMTLDGFCDHTSLIAAHEIHPLREIKEEKYNFRKRTAMSVLLTILLVLVAIIVLLLITALFMRKNHYLKRDIVINAPRQKVFDFVKLIENQEKFNTHAMVDSGRKKEFKGTDGTVGYIYSWSGDKNAGTGEKEIMNIIEGKKVEMEIRFTKPMVTAATIILETESLSDNQTKVSWSNAGILKYPVNIFIPIMEKNVAKAMDASLNNLKNILEK